jgi:threonine synthase
MTTVADTNVHNVAVDGTFDDAQNLVKALFADQSFAKAQHLAAVNSINFARIAAQCVYYFAATARLGPATFVVPTGNFGDVFAGEVASRMGLALKKLVIATNSNDIIARALETGVYEAGRAQATLSPAMDIQVASNFERALFEASGRDAAWVADAMRTFSGSGRLEIRPDALSALCGRYQAGRADDSGTLATMRAVHEKMGTFIDPHTAVAMAVARKTLKSADSPIVILATAHPAKFPEAVARATGKTPPLPRQLEGLLQAEERYDILPNDLAALKTYIAERIRPA